MKSTRSGFLAAAAAIAAFGGMAQQASPDAFDAPSAKAGNASRSDVTKNSPSRTAERNRMHKAMFGGVVMLRSPNRWPGTGWSVATDRRRAKKARNVSRNRAAHRRAA